MRYSFLLKVIIIINSIFLLSSCNVDVDPPKVTGVIPGYQAIVNTDSLVSVRFSKSMNKERTENSFSLYSSERTINGYFSWSDSNKLMTYTPELPLENGYYYTVKISTNCEDDNGNNLISEYISGFFVGNDLIPPGVNSVFPENLAQSFSLDGTIRITFTEPMDRIKTEKSIKFTPSIEGTCNWNDDGTIVTFTPFASLTFNTDYMITVTTDAVDTAGNKMTDKFISFFKAGEEFIRPEIISVIDVSSGTDWTTNDNYYLYEGIEKDTSIIITFSEPVDKESFSDSLKIIPDVEKYFEWNLNSDTCTINFIKELTVEQIYDFRVLNGVKDLSGNWLADDFIVYFNVNGAGSLAPEINLAEAFDSGSMPITLIRDDIVYLGDEYSADNRYDMRITFSRDMDRTSIHENVEVSFVSGEQPAMEGSASMFLWSDPVNPYTVLTLTLSTIEGGNLYKIKFKGGENGIMGMNGVPLSEDICFYFRFEADD